MIQTPVISIIMPIYNAAQTLSESIASVQAQTLGNWELILIDDGSRDDSHTIAERIARDDSRIRILKQSNQGPAAARNTGIAVARADLLAFLDADDHWAPERLSGMITNLNAYPNTGVMFSRTRFVHRDMHKTGTLTPHFAELDAVTLMAENPVCSTSNIVCRKRVIDDVGGFSNGLNYAEDQDWLLRVALDGRWVIRGVNAEWFFYRSTDCSQSANLEEMRVGWMRMAANACLAYPDSAPSAVSKAFGPIHRQLARRALRMAKPKTALHYLSMALRRDPLLVLRQPKRTLLTVIGTLVSFFPSTTVKELVAR